MPLYEYKCEKCDHRFEELKTASSDPETKCPECGTSETKKLVSATQFSGNGLSSGFDGPACNVGGG